MSKRKTQKILVPKGTINPNEDVLIEIPVELRDQPMVVAKRPDRNRNFRKYSRMEDEEEPVTRARNRDRTRYIDRDDSYDGFSTLYRSQSRNRSALYKSGVEDLDETEQLEKQLIQSKLEEFQQARRLFILETTGVATNASGASYDFRSTNESGCNESGFSKKLLSSTLIGCGNQTEPPPDACNTRKSHHRREDDFEREENTSCLNSSRSRRPRSREKGCKRSSGGFLSNIMGWDETDEEDTSLCHMQELMTDFDDARRKLNRAVKLATTTLEQFTMNRNFSDQNINSVNLEENSSCSNKKYGQIDQQSRKKSSLRRRSFDDSSVKHRPKESRNKTVADEKAEELQSTIANLLNHSLENISYVKDLRSEEETLRMPKCCRESKSSNSIKFARTSTPIRHKHDQDDDLS